MAAKRASKTDTRQRLLKVATELMQTRGYNGFSFKDVAESLGVSHVAVHHHFKTKADLVTEALRSYTDAFLARIDDISGDAAPTARLREYASCFAETMAADRICLCGMLAAEYAALPESARPEVRRFYEDNERWLAKTIAKLTGRRPSAAVTQKQAKAFLASLEGAMISARAFDDPARLTAAAEWLVGALDH